MSRNKLTYATLAVPSTLSRLESSRGLGQSRKHLLYLCLYHILILLLYRLIPKMKAQSVASAAGAGVLLAAGVSAEATFKVSRLPLSSGGWPVTVPLMSECQVHLDTSHAVTNESPSPSRYYLLSSADAESLSHPR